MRRIKPSRTVTISRLRLDNNLLFCRLLQFMVWCLFALHYQPQITAILKIDKSNDLSLLLIDFNAYMFMLIVILRSFTCQ